MQEFSREQIEARYEKSSPKVKEMLESATLVETVRAIGTQYKIHVDKLEELYDEVGLVLLGLVPADQFVNDLEERLGGSQMTINAVAKEIDEAIFRPIRTSLLAASEKEKTEHTVISSTTEPLTSTAAAPSPSTQQPAHTVMDDTILKEAGIETVPEHPATEIPDWPKLPNQKDILKEIEQPAAASQKVTPQENTLPGPTAAIPSPGKTDSLPHNLPIKTDDPPLPSVQGKGHLAHPRIPTPPTPTKTPSSDSTIFEKKLANMVKLPNEDVEMKQTAKEGIEVAKQIDPYREAIE